MAAPLCDLKNLLKTLNTAVRIAEDDLLGQAAEVAVLEARLLRPVLRHSKELKAEYRA